MARFSDSLGRLLALGLTTIPVNVSPEVNGVPFDDYSFSDSVSEGRPKKTVTKKAAYKSVNNWVKDADSFDKVSSWLRRDGVKGPQRRAILSTILGESGGDYTKTNSANYFGLVQMSPQRAPKVRDLEGQYKHLMSALKGEDLNLHWTHGGAAGRYSTKENAKIYIKSNKDAVDMFWKADNDVDALSILTRAFIAPEVSVNGKNVFDMRLAEMNEMRRQGL